jgi:hypothetical protein
MRAVDSVEKATYVNLNKRGGRTMGFQTGKNDTETGGLGFTKSNTNVGISGRADSDAASSNAGVGGSGVFGFSTVPNAAGVFGINEAQMAEASKATAALVSWV